MTYVSIRPERFSYKIIEESKEFVINLTTEALVHSVDYCGVKSGKDVDKFKECSLTASKSVNVSAPSIEESPVNIECKVVQIIKTGGTHDIFIAEVLSVSVDDKYFDETGKFHLNAQNLYAILMESTTVLANLSEVFGYSVRKKKNKKYKGKEKGVKK